MTRRKLTWRQLEDGAKAGLASGRFEYKGYGGYIACTVCGRRGGAGAPWMENCLLGHLWMCGIDGCERKFATRQAVKAHRRLGHSAG